MNLKVNNRQILFLKRCFGRSALLDTKNNNNDVIKINENEIEKRLLNPELKERTFQRLKSLTSDNHSWFSGFLKEDVKSAVLMPFCFVDGKLSLLFIIRSPFQPSHAGQVGFPGGNVQEGDLSFQDTALRETYEELGIPSDLIDVWTSVTTPKQFQRPLGIVLGFVKDYNHRHLQICQREVENVFTLPLSYLLDPKNQGHTRFRWQMQMPVFVNSHRNVWGLTSMITNVFLKALFPESQSLETFLLLRNIEQSHT